MWRNQAPEKSKLAHSCTLQENFLPGGKEAAWDLGVSSGQPGFDAHCEIQHQEGVHLVTVPTDASPRACLTSSSSWLVFGISWRVSNGISCLWLGDTIPDSLQDQRCPQRECRKSFSPAPLQLLNENEIYITKS